MDKASIADRRDYRFLRYWAANLASIGAAGRNWPGFQYTPKEWQRFEMYGETVAGGAAFAFMVTSAAIFIAIAALVIGLIFVPAMTLLYPDPAKTSAAVFISLLFATCFVTIGVGLPIAMNLGGRIADRFWTDASTIVLSELDRRLARKVRSQIWRMIGLLCGVGVPATLICIAYNIDLGPVAQALKWVVYVANLSIMGLTIWGNHRLKQKERALQTAGPGPLAG
jgi:hypothetical protein